MADAKESAKKITLEELLKRIEALEERVHMRDKPVSVPERGNYNTDPGPWQKKPAVSVNT